MTLSFRRSLLGVLAFATLSCSESASPAASGTETPDVPVSTDTAEGTETSAPDAPASPDLPEVPDVAADPDVPDIAEEATAPDAVTTPFKVLFIGNSYTYYNDLPGMVAQFAAGAGVTVEADSVTQGGATLQALNLLPSVIEALETGGWTHVVLQGQSLEPASAIESFLDGARKLSDRVKAVPAAVAFYTTWPRKPGDSMYLQAFTGGTPEAFAAALQAGYQQAADENGGVRVKVGDAWMLSLADHPEIELFDPDGSHPSAAGSYLAACVFASTLFGADPATVTWRPTKVTEADAAALRAVCSEVAKPGP